MKPTRLVIYPKDIQVITGKSYTHALRLYRAMRRQFKKEGKQAVTVDEFSAFMGIEMRKVVEFLFG